MNLYHTNIFESIIPQFKQYQETIFLIDSINLLVKFEKELCDMICDQVANGKKFIIFHCYTETLILNEISIIHRIIKQVHENINFDNFYFITGATNNVKAYDDWCVSQNIDVKLKILETWYFETVCREHHLDIEDFPTTYQIEDKVKYFLCYNRKVRPHRLILLEKVLENDLLDKFYYSFMDKNIKNQNQYPLITKNQDMFPINLESGRNRHNPVTVIPEDYEYFKNSLLSVVTETIFFPKKTDQEEILSDSIFFSEKVFKPIMMLHPFILLSRPYSLSMLRDRGYQTFNGIIDESYDQEENDNIRLEMILEEIKRISSFDQNQKFSFMQEVKPIVEYNQKHFFKPKLCCDYSI